MESGGKKGFGFAVEAISGNRGFPDLLHKHLVALVRQYVCGWNHGGVCRAWRHMGIVKVD